MVINASPASIGRARGTLARALYLKRVLRLLNTSSETILSQLTSIRSHLAQHSNFRVLVIANIEALPNPVSSWKILTSHLDNSHPPNPLESRLSRLTPTGLSPGSSAYIIPLPTIDGSFAVANSRGPSSLLDPRVPALMVALSYLDAVEGPLWTSVRGTGLAYGVSFSRTTESGHLNFDVYRSPNAFAAFSASKSVIEGFVSGKTEFEPLGLEGAISGIVLGIASGQASMASAAQGSFIRQVIRGLPADWNELILERVRAVKVNEIKDVMREVVLPIFESATSNLIVTCGPIMEEVSNASTCCGLLLSVLVPSQCLWSPPQKTKAFRHKNIPKTNISLTPIFSLQEQVKGFQSLGFKPVVQPLARFQDDYGIEDGEDGHEDDPDDEDEDEDEDGDYDDDEEDDK